MPSSSASRVFSSLLAVSHEAVQPVTVNYATANGTALAGLDYQAVSGTLTFATGQVSKTVTVPIIGDTLPEGTEIFFLNLSNPVNGTLADGQGMGVILDDDSGFSVGGGAAPAPELARLMAESGRPIAPDAGVSESVAPQALLMQAGMGAPPVQVSPGSPSTTWDSDARPDQVFADSLDWLMDVLDDSDLAADRQLALAQSTKEF